MKNAKNEQNEKSEYEKINKRKRVPLFFEEESLTQQQFKDESDINLIVKKYQITGELPEQKQGIYADVSNIPDYQQALEIVKNAEDMFMSLPARLRSQFSNNPEFMLNWIKDPANRDQAVSLGLIEGDTSEIKPPQPTEKKEENNSQQTK